MLPVFTSLVCYTFPLIQNDSGFLPESSLTLPLISLFANHIDHLVNMPLASNMVRCFHCHNTNNRYRAGFTYQNVYKELFPVRYLWNRAALQESLYSFESRAHLENLDYAIDKNGIPCCPNDPSLPMKYEGICKLKSGVTRYKFICPKVVWEKDPSSGKNHRVCKCGNPCTTSSCGRMIYTYPEKELPPLACRNFLYYQSASAKYNISVVKIHYIPHIVFLGF